MDRFESDFSLLFINFRIPPDHELIQQIKLTLNDIYTMFPRVIPNTVPWILSSPVAFVKKPLKRTISLPLIGGMMLLRRRQFCLPSIDLNPLENQLNSSCKKILST